MTHRRDVFVHLLPGLAPAGCMAGSVAVVIDVLRATTTIIHALAAGCRAVYPCPDLEAARQLARQIGAGQAILGGERGGRPLPDFDLGNSPREYTAATCVGKALVLSTTNGTAALVRAAEAERVLVAGFVNLNAVREQLVRETRPVHIVCAGTDGAITLEDTLLAGALAGSLAMKGNVRINDSARLATICFEQGRNAILDVLELSAGGANLRALGYDEDIRIAAQIDTFTLVPEVRRDPLRIEII
jgi:2-phosphosulfolactate phosphatase